MAYVKVLGRDGEPLIGARVQIYNSKGRMLHDKATGHGGKTAAICFHHELLLPTESQPKQINEGQNK